MIHCRRNYGGPLERGLVAVSRQIRRRRIRVALFGAVELQRPRAGPSRSGPLYFLPRKLTVHIVFEVAVAGKYPAGSGARHENQTVVPSRRIKFILSIRKAVTAGKLKQYCATFALDQTDKSANSTFCVGYFDGWIEAVSGRTFLMAATLLLQVR